MPANRLDDTPIAVQRFDVAGKDSPNFTEFVRHVGLAKEDRSELTRESSHVPLIHMMPPFRQDDAADADAIDTIAKTDLTADEQFQIAVFIDELSGEYEAENARPNRQYIIHPHTIGPDTQFPFRRFNCAGFVVEAYRDAGVELLEIDDSSLPRSSLETLKMAYPDHARRLDKTHFRAAYGLRDDGPWPVVLAGYVVNSMAREAAEIRATPYRPIDGDGFFPSRSAIESDDAIE